MLKYIDRGAYWDCAEAQIIFNPVSVSKNEVGRSVFNQVVKKLYPKVYFYYQDYMEGISKNKLLGDIQLIQIDSRKFMMNAYVYIEDEINEKALTKALIEMSNLLEEYHINGALRSTFGSKDKNKFDDFENIIKVIFSDNKQDIYIFSPIKK